jgi:predicted dienelactone hydrolase
MMKRLLQIAVISMLAVAAPGPPAHAQSTTSKIQEEIWGLPLVLPTLAYVVRPVGDGPFPLVVMDHGVAMNPKERSFFPLSRVPRSAHWFASRLHGSGASRRRLRRRCHRHAEYGPTALSSRDRSRKNPNFRDPGLAVAAADTWIIDYMTAQKKIVPDKVVVVGQSAGGWQIALSLQPGPGSRHHHLWRAAAARRRQAQQ